MSEAGSNESLVFANARRMLGARGIDGSRRDLVDEFMLRPSGPHTPDLFAVLMAMRSGPAHHKHFLYTVEPHESWELAILGDDVGYQPEHTGLVFTDLEEAERHVFALRWEHLFPPDPAGDDPGGTDPPAGAIAGPSESDGLRISQREPVALCGYLDRDSVIPGGRLTAYVSSSVPRYHAALVRLITPEVGASVRPYRAEPVACPGSGDYEGGEQELRPGSYAYVAGALPVGGEMTVALGLRSTARTRAPQAIFSMGWGSAGPSLVMTLDEGGTLVIRASRDGTPVATLRGSLAIPLRRWVGVALSVSGATGHLAFEVAARGRQGLELPIADSAAESIPALEGWALPTVPTLLGAEAVAPRGDGITPRAHFTGRLERPLLVGRASTRTELEALAAGSLPDGEGVLARWDLAVGMAGTRMADVGGAGHNGVFVNLPTRAVRGSTWTGETLDWRLCPDQYDAVHFHADDLADAGWEPSFDLEIPPGLASGLYGLQLSAPGATEWTVPFAVRPARQAGRRPIVFLLPTCTYAAYANMRLRATSRVNEPMHGRLTVLDEIDLYLLASTGLGSSTYDTHLDGSQVVYSSLRRPVTNFRPTGRIYKFCEDLLIVDWMTHEGIEFDVVTDEDLHREGVSALAGHQVVVTASHPEYVSRRMLDALEHFVLGGGRMMYLGGNGFYQAAEFHDSLAGTVEVRRPGQDGLFPTDNGETNFACTGEPGGLWSKLGRPAEQLSGVSYVSQGFDACAGYLRNETVVDERLGFVFDSVEGKLIGDFGILRGGAAGYEVDAMSFEHGTPAQAVRLASSGGHSNVYDIMVSAVIDRLPRDADTLDPVRADMVFVTTAEGGAVFSVGSIAWCGSLCHNDFDNAVSRVTRNVLSRFLDPSDFEPQRMGESL
jgi:N,N-dimethylformamidase